MITLFFLIPTVVVSAEESYNIEDYAKDMQPGWNLGNTFDAVGEDETAWGNPYVTKELIESIANQGYKSIRIPITFDQRMDDGPNYQIHEDYLERVTQAVDWSLDAGMKVMINIHHDSWLWLESGMENNHDETVARFEAIWEQLAEHFEDYPIDLMFESINEPRFEPYDNDKDLAYLNEINSCFYDIIRNSGGNNPIRPIVIPTMHTGQEQIYLDTLTDWIKEKNDPYMIATIHYYGFWPFSVNIAGYTRFDQDTANDIHEIFDRVHNQFTQNGIPVVIGEFGLLGFDQNVYTIQQGEKLKFFEYIIHYAQEKDFVHMLWDNGQHFDRSHYTWFDQEFFALMKASFSGRSATAEADFIYFKQDEEITDQQLDLNLNGHTLVDVTHNGQTLIQGSDYTVNDSTLILKADLLSDLIKLDQVGLNTSLQLVFDQGASWRVDLITYQTPILSENEDHYTEFSIPTRFNGDHLATLEAIYADGSPAGPQDWTSFKEFAYVFSPDYDEGKVNFTYDEWENYSRLFDEIRSDEPVTIRLHFWSGTILDYELVRSGDQVTGYPLEADHDDTDDDEVEDDEKDQEDDKDEEDDQVTDDEDPNEEEQPAIEEDGDEDEDSQSPEQIEEEKPEIQANDDVHDRTQLPKTATTLFNMLIAGLGLLIIGTAIFLYTKKKKTT